MIFIALRMLLGNPSKYLGMIFGVLFATLLMAHQSSIFYGLMLRTASQIEDVIDADLWVMDPNTSYIEVTIPIREVELQRVKSIPGVKWASPFVKGMVVGTKSNGSVQQLLMLGIDDLALTGLPRTTIEGDPLSLYRPKTLMIDLGGYDLLYPKAKWIPNQELEINNRKARIVGITDASPPFTSFPVAYTRYSEALSYLQSKSTKKLSYVLVKVNDKKDIQVMKQRISDITGLKALTKGEFAKDTIMYYIRHTGIPINFGITVSLGFIVGVAIVGQTFYIFIMENMKHFGALKAIGASNRQILRMVLVQAITVGLVGYGLGIGLSNLFFVMASKHILIFRGFYLPIPITLGTLAAVCLIIVVSCLASLRAVFKLDPAVVFKM
jgi:putative ABC transport system permease protein